MPCYTTSVVTTPRRRFDWSNPQAARSSSLRARSVEAPAGSASGVVRRGPPQGPLRGSSYRPWVVHVTVSWPPAHLTRKHDSPCTLAFRVVAVDHVGFLQVHLWQALYPVPESVWHTGARGQRLCAALVEAVRDALVEWSGRDVEPFGTSTLDKEV